MHAIITRSWILTIDKSSSDQHSSPNFAQINYRMHAIITRSWILTIHKSSSDQYSSPNFAQINYRTCTIINHSWLQIALEYWPKASLLQLSGRSELHFENKINQSWPKLKISSYCYKWIDTKSNIKSIHEQN